MLLGADNACVLDAAVPTGAGYAQRDKYQSPHSASDIVLQSNLHAVPLICLVIDFSHNTLAFPLRHVQLLVIFMLIYLIINMCKLGLIQPTPCASNPSTNPSLGLMPPPISSLWAAYSSSCWSTSSPGLCFGDGNSRSCRRGRKSPKAFSLKTGSAKSKMRRLGKRIPRLKLLLICDSI